MRLTAAAVAAFYCSKTWVGLPTLTTFRLRPVYDMVFDALFIQILVEFCFFIFPNNMDELTKPNLMLRLT